MHALPLRSARMLALVMLLLCSTLLVAPLQSAPVAAAPPAPDTTAAQSFVTSESGRWIIRLQAPPLAQAPATRPEFATMTMPADVNGKMQIHSTAALQYRSQLQQQQSQLFQSLQRSFPAAQLERDYQVVMNALAVSLPAASAADIERIRALPDVAEIYPDLHYELQTAASIPLINAPAMWDNAAIGGQQNAGAGIKIAIIDSGIAIDNPFFDPTGYSYPEGYPIGDTAHTTPKVIAARYYPRPGANALPGSDNPQPGPLDSSHGTHVAGIAAGNANTEANVAGLSQTISGVAPRAYLMNYKVFYANDSIFAGAFSIELIASLEDAVLDGADVINNSWGGRASVDPAANPIVDASDAAVDAGVAVVFAAGNEGPSESTAGSPSYSDKVLSVGSITTDQAIAAGFLDTVAPEGAPEDIVERPFAPANFGTPVSGGIFGPAPYTPVVTQDGTGLACDPLPAGSLEGQIALIERGVCEFSLKALNVQQGGAIGAIIYNSEAGGESLVAMAAGAGADQVTIPAVFVQRSTGLGLLNWYSDNPGSALLQLDPQARIIEQTASVLADSSSRGPTFQHTLKPDVVAPGVSIVSAGNAPGAEGMAQHLGFGVSSGTSMAAPHGAGAVALLRQIHPEWSPADIKSALMSTASQEVWLDDERTTSASVLGDGAGRMDLARAADPGLVFDRPSLSFGTLPTVAGEPTSAQAVVTARNVTGEVQTYSLSARATDGAEFGLGVTPAQITLGPQEQATFTVAVEVPADAPAGDYGGLVELSGPQALHLPVWVRTRAAEKAATVLLIDNDGSTSLGLTDYSGYYANALLELGVSTTYLDLDALAPVEQTLPDIAELQRYEVIIWFTGDNFVPSTALAVPVPLTPADQDVLIAYLQSGGRLIATGQDLTEASDIEANPPDPRYGRSDLYHSYLGARWVQDNVFSDTVGLDRTAVGIGNQPWTTGIRLDLSAPPAGVMPSDLTGAGNQESVDEVTVVDADPRDPDEYTVPIFRTEGAVDDTVGILALARTAQHTLEEPALALPYRSIYLSFGLEGVRNDTGLTTRQELLQMLLWWSLDNPVVTLDQSVVTITEPNQAVTIAATASTNTPAEFVRYRWDFGDGTRYLQTPESVVTHTYAEPGTYQVRVEATNTWDHTAISAIDPFGPAVEPQITPQAADTPAAHAPAALTFEETGHTLQGRFLQFWQDNGGLAVFGYPISAQSDTTPTSQTFERTRFEYHPDNAAPYDVLLGRIGVETLEAQGRNWQSFPTVESAPADCLYFEETQHSLCGAFLDYWQRNGLEFDGLEGSSYAESLALFGLPISEPQEETLEDGSTRLVQWFERTRFEYHPDNAAPYDVLLGRLGSGAR